MKQDVIKQYINNLRIQLAPHLKNGVGVSCEIVPWTDGAVVVCSLGEGMLVRDKVLSPKQNIRQALDATKLFTPLSSSVKIKGTEYFFPEGKIVLVKDAKVNTWTNVSAIKDVGVILNKISRKNVG